jgi:hypothetical protein
MTLLPGCSERRHRMRPGKCTLVRAQRPTIGRRHAPGCRPRRPATSHVDGCHPPTLRRQVQVPVQVGALPLCHLPGPPRSSQRCYPRNHRGVSASRSRVAVKPGGSHAGPHDESIGVGHDVSCAPARAASACRNSHFGNRAAHGLFILALLRPRPGFFLLVLQRRRCLLEELTES